jgi:osmotically-inducible protein OsmY
MQRRFVISAGVCLLATLAVSPVSSMRSEIAPAAGPSDAWLNTTAKIAILTSIGTRGSTVHVDTINATMTLYGKVPSMAEKENVEKLASRVGGVREIRNFLMIAPVAEDTLVARSDSEVQSEVAVAVIVAGLKEASPLRQSHVSVASVNAGVVLLAGTANNLAAHLHAVEAARSVRGVRAVKSDVRSSDAQAVYHARLLGQ